jgi:RNA polymerase sigma-70 factor (ECF subfamily)
VEERQLIAQVLAGDSLAQRTFYDTHVDRVYRLTYRLAGDDDLARDFTQDTFIRAFERLAEFRSESSVSTWLHSIAVSVALNGLRKVKRIRSREAPIDDGMHVGHNVREADPDLKERLAKAVDELSEDYRTVLVMHDIEGYTHEEIGAVLGVPSGTSKARLFRARAKLRESLADFADLAGDCVS